MQKIRTTAFFQQKKAEENIIIYNTATAKTEEFRCLLFCTPFQKARFATVLVVLFI